MGVVFGRPTSHGRHDNFLTLITPSIILSETCVLFVGIGWVHERQGYCWDMRAIRERLYTHALWSTRFGCVELQQFEIQG